MKSLRNRRLKTLGLDPETRIANWARSTQDCGCKVCREYRLKYFSALDLLIGKFEQEKNGK